MVSKYDHCLQDLFSRHQYGELNADIALVVSNHPDLRSLAEDFNTPYFHVPVNKDNKAESEKATLKLFEEHQVDFVVLARYMQILTPLVLGRYPNKIINIHHGFLPAFMGAKPYHQAYEKGVKIIGATAHYANEDLDMGPIISQETVHVNHSHSAEDMRRLGRDVEKQVLARAVNAHIEDKIMFYNNRTIVFDSLY
jgi:formyltetrahydrofolate deformylase